MERRGRASDCQRSYDFTQYDLPPPLTAEHTPRSRLAPAYPQRDEHGTPSLVQSGLTFGAAVLLLGPAMALLAPFSAPSTRSSSSRASAFAYLWRWPRWTDQFGKVTIADDDHLELSGSHCSGTTQSLSVTTY